ncbi:hypothetical protein R6Q59_000001 [Mikania micrantha]
MAQTYGPVMMIHLGTPVLVASSVDGAKEIMKTHDLSYQHVRSNEIGIMMDKIQGANGSVLNLSELVFTLTNNVVCRVALGRTYEGMKFKNLLERTMELLGCFSVGVIFRR